MTEEKKKKKPMVSKGCLFTLLIGFVIIIILAVIGNVAYRGYDQAAKKNAINSHFNPMYSDISKKYKSNFSNKEIKQLVVKIYLINQCKGGKERIELLRGSDQFVLENACSILLEMKKENTYLNPSIEINNLKKLKDINFKGALKEYDFYITE